MVPAHPTGRTPRPAPSPTLHPIYRPSPGIQYPQQFIPSPVESLEPPSRPLTAVDTSASSLRSALKPTSSHSVTTFQRQRPKVAVLLADVVGIVIPVGFIAFAVVICKINGTRTNPDAPPGTRTNSLGPYRDPINIFATAFPIVFAALVGRLITMFIRWKLERGAGIQSLERLLGSRTVGNTVLTMFLLPLSWFTIILIVVWAFSPLGAQSILRILDTQMYPTTRILPDSGNGTLSYFNTDASSQLGNPHTMLRTPTSTGQIIGDLTVLTSMYLAAVMSPDSIKNSSADLWGNLKIPFVDSYPTVKEWQVPPQASVDASTTFSSLIGIPVLNIPEGNSSFLVESSYVNLEHESNDFHPFEITTYTKMDTGRLGNHLGSWNTKPDNGTFQGYSLFESNDTSAPFALGVDTFISPFWIEGGNPDMTFRSGPGSKFPRSPAFFRNETGVQTTPTRLKLELEVPGANLTGLNDTENGIFKMGFIESYFKVTQHYVESRVNCTRGLDGRPNCAVVANRPSLKPHAPEDITQMSFPLIFHFLSSRLPTAANTASATKNGPNNNTDPSLAYLLTPSVKDMLNANSRDLQMLLDLPPPVLARRLATLINTFLTLGQTLKVAATGIDSLGRAGVNVSVEVITTEERYTVHVEWMGVYIAASVVLLIGGILGTVFAHSALGPEVLGYATSVLRDSKYVELAAGDARLDGMDLANKLGEKRFKFGFVEGRAHGGEGAPLLGVAEEENVRGLR